jgi:hypothetical protein
MSFEVNKQVGENYVLYEISGLNSLQSFVELADDIRKYGIQHQISNFILDCGGIRGSLSMGELFELGNYFASKLRACKLAAIHTPPEWRNNQFSENVIHNRGGQLEHFQSIEDAERWFSKI